MVSVLASPGVCIKIIIDSLHVCGNDPSTYDLLLTSSNLYNAGFPKFISFPSE